MFAAWVGLMGVAFNHLDSADDEDFAGAVEAFNIIALRKRRKRRRMLDATTKESSTASAGGE